MLLPSALARMFTLALRLRLNPDDHLVAHDASPTRLMTVYIQYNSHGHRSSQRKSAAISIGQILRDRLRFHMPFVVDFGRQGTYLTMSSGHVSSAAANSLLEARFAQNARTLVHTFESQSGNRRLRILIAS